MPGFFGNDGVNGRKIPWKSRLAPVVAIVFAAFCGVNGRAWGLAGDSHAA
jgi:hypothetical protein